MHISNRRMRLSFKYIKVLVLVMLILSGNLKPTFPPLLHVSQLLLPFIISSVDHPCLVASNKKGKKQKYIQGLKATRQ